MWDRAWLNLMIKAEIDRLIGKAVGEWKLLDVVGSGKSAVVFRGVKGLEVAAVKIFNPSLVEELGKDTQLKRIERELELRGHDHPNLVRIFDGGECPTTGHLFVVMEFIDAPNLASVLDRVPRERIRLIISQVAAAARYLLEDRNIVHRDIKPDNIAIDPEFLRPTLLDLGVIRPVDISKLAASSGGERESFVGTLRYSPPEYLFREEEQDKNGYRAMTFYQLGGVLYDLIMRERLFLASSFPFARLVRAIENDHPKIQQPDVPKDLILLARTCLLKTPEHRLKYIKWEDFEESPSIEQDVAIRQRVMSRFASSLEPTSQPSSIDSSWDAKRVITTIQQRITNILKDICSGERMFPRSDTRELPVVSDPHSAGVLIIFEAEPNLEIGEALALLVSVTLVDTEPELVEINIRTQIGYIDCEEELDTLRASTEEQIFQGVFDETIVSTALASGLFRAVDSVQSQFVADRRATEDQ